MFLDEYDDEIFTKRMYKAIAEESRAKAQEQINQLNKFLVRDERQEDLLKSFSDSRFQKKLLEEYGLLDQDSRT